MAAPGIAHYMPKYVNYLYICILQYFDTNLKMCSFEQVVSGNEHIFIILPLYLFVAVFIKLSAKNQIYEKYLLRSMAAQKKTICFT